MAPPAHPTGEWYDDIPKWSRGQRGLAAAVAVLFAVAVSGPLLAWAFARPARTISSVPPPVWTGRAFRSGQAMRDLEKHLKESSWVTLWLRGILNETLWRLGQLHSKDVVIGRDDWLFLDDTIRWEPAALAEAAGRRKAILAEARAAATRLGLHLLVLPAPDKSTIYPEFVGTGRPLPAGRARLYDQILEDLAAAGLPFVDVRGLLLAYKRANPDDPVFFERDTHWCLSAQRVVAKAVAERIRAEGWGDVVVPDPHLVVKGPLRQPIIPDLLKMLGMRGEENADIDTLPPLVRSLTEVRLRLVALRESDGTEHEVGPVQPGAAVALCGTSYSNHFAPVLMAQLGTPVDHRGVATGGGSFRGLRKVLAEAGTDGWHPRIVLWEFVERDYQKDWTVVRSLVE